VCLVDTCASGGYLCLVDDCVSGGYCVSAGYLCCPGTESGCMSMRKKNKNLEIIDKTQCCLSKPEY
jgi:hypothetical protein